MASDIRMLLRLPSDINMILRARADREGRSVNGMIVQLLKEGLHGNDERREEAKAQAAVQDSARPGGNDARSGSPAGRSRISEQGRLVAGAASERDHQTPIRPVGSTDPQSV
jgi:hypothetical protein